MRSVVTSRPIPTKCNFRNAMHCSCGKAMSMQPLNKLCVEGTTRTQRLTRQITRRVTNQPLMCLRSRAPHGTLLCPRRQRTPRTQPWVTRYPALRHLHRSSHQQMVMVRCCEVVRRWHKVWLPRGFNLPSHHHRYQHSLIISRLLRPLRPLLAWSAGWRTQRRRLKH